MMSNTKARRFCRQQFKTGTGMEIPFEPTRSFCYHFSRYQALPDVLESPEAASGAPFRLLDVSKRVIDKYLTPEQQATMLKRAESDREDPMLRVIKYYIPFIAKNTDQLIPLGNGMFRLPTADDINDDDLEEAALEEEVAADADDFDGSVYAFSFPVLVKDNGPFPIKVGKTTGDVDARVQQQCKRAATFDNPVILGRWPVKRVGAVESAIHSVLRSRGKWRENVPGIEWFDTTVREIESIVTFVVNFPA
jgi:hypothetical protein